MNCKYENSLGCKPLEQADRKYGCEIKILLVLIFVVCVWVLAAYRPVLSAQALFFDDEEYFIENVPVQNPGWTSAKKFLIEIFRPSTVAGYYQPLTMISLMADYAMGGRSDNLVPLHTTSLALHIMNTGWVIILLYLLFDGVWTAAAVGLLFGLHPMTADTVAWISERKTLLAAFFSLLSLIFYVLYVKSGHQTSDHRPQTKKDLQSKVSSLRSQVSYAVCLAAYVLALLSKPTSVPLPMLMLMMDFWPLRRLSWRSVREKLPFFVIGGISAVITFISQRNMASAVLPGEYNPAYIPMTLCHNIVFYICKILWPVDVSPYYPFPLPLAFSNPVVLVSVIASGLLILFLAGSLYRTRSMFTGWLIFFTAALPTMGVIGFTNVIAANKFVYLPSFGFMMLLASFSSWLCLGKHKNRRIAAAAVVLILVGAETFALGKYLTNWRDTVGLFKYMMRLAPDDAMLNYGMGRAMSKHGTIDQAINYYRRALEIRPCYFSASYNLGLSLEKQNKSVEAIDQFYLALKCNPNRLQPWGAIGNVLAAHPELKIGNAKDIIALAEHAVKSAGHRDIAVLEALAALYASSGQFERAAVTAQDAMDLARSRGDDQSAGKIRQRFEIYLKSGDILPVK